MPLMLRREESDGRVVGVELQQANIGFELAGGTLEHRRHRAARTAPGRPDVDQQRDVAVCHVAAEAGFVDFDRPTAEDRLMAGSTAGRRRRPFGG